MTSYRKSPSIYTVALILFGVTAILPVAYMLAQFAFELFSRPSQLMSILIDGRQLILLGRSVMIAFAAAAVALLFGLPVATILAARDMPYRRLFYFLVLIPLLIPSYVMAGAWIHLLSPGGVINRFLIGAFGPAMALSVHSIWGCAWCMGISFFPVIALIVATGLSKIDSNLIDVARLSTNRWGVFRHAILPQISAHLLASVCLVLIFSLAQYGVPSLLGINTYPVEIFAQFSAFYDDTAAIATGIPLIVFAVLLVLFQRRVMRAHDYVRITPDSETNNPVRMGRAKYGAAAFLIILLIVTTILPFLSVLAGATGFSKVISTLRSFGDGVLTTSLLAVLAAGISTAIAFPIGCYLAKNRGRLVSILDVICWLPIAVPGTIAGLGVIKLSGLVPVLQRNDSVGLWLLLAYIGMFSAFSIRIAEAAYRRADPNIDEAAAIDCRRWYQRLFYISIPLRSKAIAASIILVFVLVLGELNATVLLIPPGKATLSVSIDNLLHYGANATASALCLIEAGLVIFAIALGLLVFQAGKRAGQAII